MNYKEFSESAKLFGLHATEKHYEDAEIFIEKFGAEIDSAAKTYLQSTLGKGSPALLAEVVSKVCEDPPGGMSYMEGILAYAFMSGFLAGKGRFKEIEAFKVKQLMENGDI